MTTTYDPKDPVYFDEADVREELTRVYDLCHGCRLCFKFCTSFPTLFEMVDKHDDQDAGRLTPAEQDQVVDECFQCKLCYINCPYIPELHEWNLDFPRLMLRADAMQFANGIKSARDKATTQMMGHTDLLGTLATSTGPFANKIVNAEPGSGIRKVVAKATGVSSVRLLPPYAKQRFSTWFKKRPKINLTKRQGKVTVFPTCLVEYQETDIGKDLVKVYERNGMECNNTEADCCGAPWLHSGNVKEFTKVAQKNIKTLAAEVRAGTDIVVPQPTCSYIIKKDYLDYVGGPDAELVAEHTYDAAEYLMAVHKGDDTVARHRLHRRDRRVDHLPHAVSPAGPEHRVQESRPDEAHRCQGQARPAVLGHRRHVGLAGRQRGHLGADREEARRSDRQGRW